MHLLYLCLQTKFMEITQIFLPLVEKKTRWEIKNNHINIME